MNLFLILIFIFYIGSSIGWILELFYSRLEYKKWVNPGFLVGPYLPIYGFGLTLLTGLYMFLGKYNFNPIYTILLMGLCMTLLELISGLIFLKAGVKLWDYRDEKLHFKGLICPKFTIIWTVIGALYYYFIVNYVLKALVWFSNNISFSYILGIFTGLIIIDFAYSTNLYKKIRKYAKNNNIDIMYEKLKLHIRNIQDQAEAKYSFLLPFRQTRNLLEYLIGYNPEISNKKRKKAKSNE